MSNHYKENRENSKPSTTTFKVTSYKSKFGQELSTSQPHSQNLKPQYKEGNENQNSKHFSKFSKNSFPTRAVLGEFDQNKK